jgi:hypothetical protein
VRQPPQNTPFDGPTSNWGSRSAKRLPWGTPSHEIGHLCWARPTPGGGPPISLILPKALVVVDVAEAASPLHWPPRHRRLCPVEGGESQKIKAGPH